MKTNLTITEIAIAIGEKVWSKGSLERIYTKKVGYNTKKMKTTAYIYKKGLEVCFFTSVDCDNQGAVWCDQRADEAKNSLIEMVEAILPENETFETEKIEVELSETILNQNNEVVDLSEKVKGYTTQWREVRVAINSYGKLATRNRQFVVFQHISKSNAPQNFVELSDSAFAFATNLGKRSETMLAPYEEVTDYEQATMAFEIRLAEMRQAENDAKEAREATESAALEFANTLENMGGPEMLKAWKGAGFPHPAPKMIMDFKNASGLNWRLFEKSI